VKEILMKGCIHFVLALLMGLGTVQAADFEIQSFDSTGKVTFDEVPGATGYRVEWASSLTGPWSTFETAAGALDHIATQGSGTITGQVPMAYRVLAATNWPEPAASCAYYTEELILPQTQSRSNLAAFLSSEHFTYDLDGWFFMGNLMETGMETNPGVFFISVQRIEQELSPQAGWGRAPLVFAVVGYNNEALGHYLVGGTATPDTWPLASVTSTPWKVEVNPTLQFPPQLTMELISGTMGVSGAVYQLTSDLPDLADTNGTPFQVDVWLQDRLGVVNQGHGTASFYPQFLTSPQRSRILQEFGGSVSDYLASTGDPMPCQGSLYYSIPLLDVIDFTITKGGSTLSSGSEGTLWMDYIVQSYDSQWAHILPTASWSFMAIRFPETNMAMTLFQMTNDVTGALPVAKLFSADSERTTNEARKAIHSWDIDEIEISVDTNSIWISPETTQQYAMVQHVLLGGDYTADLTLTMVRNNQEIVIWTKKGDPPTIKYEGEAKVEGTLDGDAISGWAFMELQPLGHL
jgi:hypothetical protein